MYKFTLFSLIALGLCCRLSGDDTQAVRQRTESYVSAFNNKDAKGMAEHWDQEATFTNRLTGDKVTGRQAIAEELEENFQNDPKTDLKVVIDSVKFPESNKAVEEGTATLASPDGETSKTNFQIDFVKRNDNWYIAGVNAVEAIENHSNYEKLKDLEWLIGQWVDKDDTAEIDSSYQWDAEKNFIIQKFNVSLLGQKDLEGTQIIGWDPVREKVRSWMFDSDGGFSESTWKKEGMSWVIESASTLSEGALGSQVLTITPIDSNSFTLEITGREIEGKILPNLDPVTIVRKGG